MRHRPQEGTRSASLRCGAVLLSLFAAQATHAQYVATEGKGYVLCERVAAHVNRLTENGRAKRLWQFLAPESLMLPYPKKQRYLTRELLSFPGFKRPPFAEHKLEDVRQLIELMGEADALKRTFGVRYKNNDPAAYVTDRKSGTVPERV